MKQAIFRPNNYLLTLYLSLGMIEIPCYTVKQARKLINESGINQLLRII